MGVVRPSGSAGRLIGLSPCDTFRGLRDEEKGPPPTAGPFSTACATLTGMWALLAVITFAVAFILKLLGTSTGKVDLLLLGLLFMAVQMLVGWGLTYRRP